MENENYLQAVNSVFRSYATPVSVSGGVLGAYADHTYVYATAGAGGAAYNCTCYGNQNVPTAADVPNVTVPGDMRLAGCMINLSAALKPNYDGWLDHCGIIYGLEGVCHNMANRILMTVGNTVMPFGTVNGYSMSFLLYGFFGQTAIPYLLRSVLAHGIAHLSGLGSVKGSSSQPVFDPEQFRKIISEIESDITGKESSFTNLLIKMELYGVSTPENRLAAMYQHYVLAGDSSKLQNDINLKKMLLVLDDFLETKAQIFARAKDNVTSKQEEHERIEQLNEEFVKFNRRMEEILGTNYLTLFQSKFNKDFCLFEYPSYK